MERRFSQVDVFATERYRGNPLAVVSDADGLTDTEMALFARWTNLSETTFLVRPLDPAADYRVRIFTPTTELPFAGHPTIGTCRVWLDHGGRPRSDGGHDSRHGSDGDSGGEIVQECAAGLVRVRRAGGQLAFAAPPLTRSGPVDADRVAAVERAIGAEVVDARWADNGPGWVAMEVTDVATLRSIRPDFAGLDDIRLGLVAACAPGDPDRYELRAFFPFGDSHSEDPVTGSLHASVAHWMMERHGDLHRYTARQGHCVGRAGTVHVDKDSAGTIWVGGAVRRCISGTVEL